MGETKENMLRTALRLFARQGYEATSISDIAAELGMTKSALYKHYAGKQAIFDAIVARMAGQYAEGDESYGRTTARDTAGYARAQFVYWTQDAFAADFRRMLTLEQYRSGEMSALYHAYLGAGPLEYMQDLFREGMEQGVWKQDDPAQAALAFYAPMHLLYAVADARGEEAALALLDEHLKRVVEERANGND